MIRVYATFISALVVQLQALWDRTVRATVKHRVRHEQMPAEPDAGVAIVLRNAELPAARVGIDCVAGFGPFRDRLFRVQPSHVLLVRHRLQMIWVHARAIAAQVIKLHSVRDWAMALFVVPDMAQYQSPISPDARIAIRPMARNYPASCMRVALVLLSIFVAADVQLGHAHGFTTAGVLGNSRLFAASAEAVSGVDSVWAPGEPLMERLETDVAPGDDAPLRVGAVSSAHGRAAAALAHAGRIWTARIARGGQHPLGVMSSREPEIFSANAPMADMRARQFTRPASARDGSKRNGSPAAAHADTRRIWGGQLFSLADSVFVAS